MASAHAARQNGPELRFLGAAGTVTGSRYLLRAGQRTILVDCGLFQGLKQLRLRNWAEFPVPPASIDAVILTHAHIDHSGYSPLLRRNGFAGLVYCTHATRDLCAILLPDSAHLQEEDARFANRHRFSKHDPALPLYTAKDVELLMPRLSPVEFGTSVSLGEELGFTFRRAGHILGAASVVLETPGSSVLFTGDLGQPDDPIALAADPGVSCDYVVTESTYGDRVHGQESAEDSLARGIRRTAERGGVVLIPAFAVGRAQLLLHYLARLSASGAIPDVPVFLDSPLAEAATRLLSEHPREHRLTAASVAALRDHTTFTHSVSQSKAIDARSGPMVIVAGSGMATGGRILHHLKRFGGDHRNLIVLSGFQAPGTRGAALAAGAAELKIHGEHHTIRAEILQLSGLSAHMDANQLVQWLGQLNRPRQCFITHGEPSASDALRMRLQEELRWSCIVPEHLAEFRL